MTVKQQKKKWNIPWKSLGITTFILGLAFMLFYVLYQTTQSTNAKRKVREVEREKVQKIKINDAISKQFDIVCDNKIIKLDNYEIIKVNDEHRVIIGNNTTELDKTHKVIKCSIIYTVKEKM